MLTFALTGLSTNQRSGTKVNQQLLYSSQYEKQRNIFTQNVPDEAVNIISIIQFQALDTHLFDTLCDKWEIDIKYFCHGGYYGCLQENHLCNCFKL